MKTIKGDLILTEDTIIAENLKVIGDINGPYDLKVIGNIDCRNIYCDNIDCLNIDCWNIDCRNIDCGNINCWDIDCDNIDCGNINCWNIDCRNMDCRNIDCRNMDCRNIVLCDKIKVKGKCIAKALIKDRFHVERKEQLKKETTK